MDLLQSQILLSMNHSTNTYGIFKIREKRLQLEAVRPRKNLEVTLLC